MVRHNTAAGAASGLELFMAKDRGLDRQRQRHVAQRDVDGYRVRVAAAPSFRCVQELTSAPVTQVSIHPPSEFPDPSLLVASWEAGSRPRVTAVHVQVSVTESAPQVRRLPPASRQCFFPDERDVRLTPVYSQRSCHAECRLLAFASACGCRPYFYRLSPGECRLPAVSAPAALTAASVCRVRGRGRVQTGPVAVRRRPRRSVLVRRHRHSPGGGAATDQVRTLVERLHCDACLASCHETLYSTDVLQVEDSNPTTDNASAYIDVFFSQLGVVKYERDLTFDSMQLLGKSATSPPHLLRADQSERTSCPQCPWEASPASSWECPYSVWWSSSTGCCASPGRCAATLDAGARKLRVVRR